MPSKKLPHKLALLERIGQGGQAEVFKAQYQATKHSACIMVAVKRFNKSIFKYKPKEKRFFDREKIALESMK